MSHFLNVSFSRNPAGPAAWQQHPGARTELRDYSSHMAFPSQAQEVSQRRGESPPHPRPRWQAKTDEGF